MVLLLKNARLTLYRLDEAGEVRPCDWRSSACVGFGTFRFVGTGHKGKPFERYACSGCFAESVAQFDNHRGLLTEAKGR